MINGKKPFDIPAINNQLEALARYLSIDSNSDEELTKIDCLGVYGGFGSEVHHFRCEEMIYSVAAQSVGLDSCMLVWFNSSLWSVKKIDQDSPYHRFKDKVVLTKLCAISPNDYIALAINQKEQKVLFRNEEDLKIVFSYTSHIPDDISTYHIRGSTTDNAKDIIELFKVA